MPPHNGLDSLRTWYMGSATGEGEGVRKIQNTCVAFFDLALEVTQHRSFQHILCIEIVPLSHLDLRGKAIDST